MADTKTLDELMREIGDATRTYRAYRQAVRVPASSIVQFWKQYQGVSPVAPALLEAASRAQVDRVRVLGEELERILK